MSIENGTSDGKTGVLHQWKSHRARVADGSPKLNLIYRTVIGLVGFALDRLVGPGRFAPARSLA